MPYRRHRSGNLSCVTDRSRTYRVGLSFHAIRRLTDCPPLLKEFVKKLLLTLPLVALIGLAGCDRPAAVVAVPVAPIVVPGPAGPTGATGAVGATGKAGEGTTVVVVPASAASSPTN